LGLRGTREQGSGEDYSRRNFKIRIPHSKNNEIGRACSMYGGEEKFLRGFGAKS